MSDLARALVDVIEADPAALDWIADRVAERLAARVEADSPELLTVVAAAGKLGVSPKTVRRRIAEGLLPAVSENGRIKVRADELGAYVEGLDRVGARPTRRRVRSARNYDFLREQ